jgi:hypothetical protein
MSSFLSGLEDRQAVFLLTSVLLLVASLLAYRLQKSVDQQISSESLPGKDSL